MLITDWADHGLVSEFFDCVVREAILEGLVSSVHHLEWTLHLSVDGTLIQSLAFMKSLRPIIDLCIFNAATFDEPTFLWLRPLGTGEELERRRRRRAVALLDEGCWVREVARMVGASAGSVTHWRQAIEKRGEVALRAKPHPGRTLMKNYANRRWTGNELCVLTVMACSVAIIQAGQPLGTEFTYQGKLNLDGEPVTSLVDFRFTPFDAESAGVQIGATSSAENIDVENGLFTTVVDFGVDSFNGDARWLMISVRSPTASEDYVTLSPRQPLTATPYSLQTRGIYVDDAGNVGIGITNPQWKLDVNGRIRSSSVEITGGSDIAEPYDVLAAGDVSPTPGMVVSIDPANIGKMRVSNVFAIDVTATLKSPVMKNVTELQRSKIINDQAMKRFTVQALGLPDDPNERTPSSFATMVNIHNQSKVLMLQRNNVLADDFKFLVQEAGGGFREIEDAPIQTYKGTIPGEPGSKVLATLADGQLIATIQTSAETWQVMPAPEGIGMARDEHVVFNAVDEIQFNGGRCGVDGAAIGAAFPMGAGDQSDASNAGPVDDDVDLVDFADFQLCYTGPAGPHAISAGESNRNVLECPQFTEYRCRSLTLVVMIECDQPNKSVAMVHWSALIPRVAPRRNFCLETPGIHCVKDGRPGHRALQLD